MIVSTTCTNGHTIRVREEHAGRRVKCPSCGEMVLITPGAAPPAPTPARSAALPPAPKEEEVVDYVPEPEPPAHEPEPTRKRKRKERVRRESSGRPVFWIVMGVSGLALVATGALVWIFALGPFIEHYSFPSDIPAVPEGPFGSMSPMYDFQQRIERLKRQHGENRVVVVCMKGIPFGSRHGVLTEFQKLGFQAENLTMCLHLKGSSDPEGTFCWLAVGPVNKETELADRITFARVVSTRVGRINLFVDMEKVKEPPEQRR